MADRDVAGQAASQQNDPDAGTRQIAVTDLRVTVEPRAEQSPPSMGWARPRITDWQLAVESRARRIHGDLATLDDVPGVRAERMAAARALDVVDRILQDQRRWWQSAAAWWSGWHIERAWRALHEAEVAVISADPHLAAHLPALRERVATYVHDDDRRRRALEQLRPAAPPSPADRAVVADALCAAFDASDDAHAGARALRNKLVITAAALVVLNTVLGVAGIMRPGMVPMCVQVQQTPRMICPAGPAPGPVDVWLVQMLGAFGALVAAVILLIRRRPSLSPYVLIGYQALIKVLLGAGLAVVGVLGLGAGITEGLICVTSQPGLLLWSVLLGYSQQVGTRLLDNYADQVMDQVRPLPDTSGASPGTVR
jgi:hypothetical protein